MFEELTDWIRHLTTLTTALTTLTTALATTTRTAVYRAWTRLAHGPQTGPAASDAGYTTEAVVVTALLAAAAIAVVAIIVAKVLDLANSIKL
jgi:hypothetical protein